MIFKVLWKDTTKSSYSLENFSIKPTDASIRESTGIGMGSEIDLNYLQSCLVQYWVYLNNVHLYSD